MLNIRSFLSPALFMKNSSPTHLDVFDLGEFGTPCSDVSLFFTMD